MRKPAVDYAHITVSRYQADTALDDEELALLDDNFDAGESGSDRSESDDDDASGDDDDEESPQLDDNSPQPREKSVKFSHRISYGDHIGAASMTEPSFVLLFKWHSTVRLPGRRLLIKCASVLQVATKTTVSPGLRQKEKCKKKRKKKRAFILPRFDSTAPGE